MGEWRHMSEAPKDGTRILAWVSFGADEANICEVWWVDDYMESEWGGYIGGWDDDWDLSHKPKAWMAKPQQPDLFTLKESSE